MLLPTDLLPAALGLRWGIRKGECLEQLQAIPSRQHQLWALVPVHIRDDRHELELQFGDRDALERVRVELYKSRSFWDDDPEWTTEEINRLYEEAAALYRSLIQQYSAVLGPPVYSGEWDWDEPGYPPGEAEGALTYWDHPQGRLQLTNMHPDAEFPIVVSLECYYVPPANEPYQANSL